MVSKSQSPIAGIAPHDGRDTPALLVVDDDRAVLHTIRQALRECRLNVVTAESAAESLAVFETCAPDAVVLDIRLPDGSGFDVFTQLRRFDPKLPVIFITADGSSRTAIEAMMLGADDFLIKPLQIANLQRTIEQAIEIRLAKLPSIELKRNAPTDHHPLIGCSDSMLELYKTIGRLAAEDCPVLIRGERGTGKELVARVIQQHRPQAENSLLTIECAFTPEPMFEAALFGRKQAGASDAAQQPAGPFDTGSGAVFLDEIGNLPPPLQYKLLRRLRQQPRSSDGVRILAGTHCDLEHMVRDDRFRADLYDQLAGISLTVPPLRQRGHDILLLFEYFLIHQFNCHPPQPVIDGIAPAAVELLLKYPWPGNVRELQRVARQTWLHATGRVIVPEALPPELRQRPEQSHSPPLHDLQTFVDRRLKAGSTNLYAEAVELMERYVVTRVLQSTSGNQTKAARVLGVTRGKIRNRMAQFRLSHGQVVNVPSGTWKKVEH